MAKQHAPLLSFNRGEVSKLALARVDIEKMRLAAECQVNWLPTVQGAMMMRPGTQYLGSTLSDAAARFVPFINGADDKALLEFTDSHMRIWSSDALLSRASVSTTVTNGDFSSGTGWTLTATDGCTVDINSTQPGQLYMVAATRGGLCSCTRSVSIGVSDRSTVHGLRIAVSRGPVDFFIGSTSGAQDLFPRTTLGPGTHCLAFNPAGNSAFHPKFETLNRLIVLVDSIQVETGTVDLGTPYVAADLGKIRYDQSGDVVFLACDGYQQRKVERRDNNSWSFVTYETENGPFGFVDTQRITLTPSVYEGDGALTASAALFKSTDTGKLFRIFSSGQTNQAVLGAAGAATETIRVSGVGTVDRGFSWVRSGTWTGTLALQRSTEGPDSGFKEVGTATTNGTTAVDDTATHNNIVAWYRVVCTAYTSGSATVSFTGHTSGVLNGEGQSSGTTVAGAAALSGRAAIVRITSVTNATSAGISVLKPFPSLTASANWQPGDWSTAQGWPSAVALHEGRLWWFRGDKRWGSVSDDFANFDLEYEGDAGPINRNFGGGPADRASWAISLTRLVVGRDTSIDPIRSSSFEEPLTPTNNTSKSCTSKGAAGVQAVRVDSRAIYVEKSERKVYELLYNIENGDYRPSDLTRLNLDIGLTGLSRMAVQEQPDTYVHFVRGDGEIASLLYEPEDEVKCWFRMMTLGVIEDVVTLPADIEDAVYLVVKRTINGSTKRYLEKMSRRDLCVGGSLSRNLDCFLSVSQSSSTTISGLSHLEGQTVSVWANGKDLGTYTVSSAAITVSEAVTTAIVGLGGTSYTYDSDTAAASVTATTAFNGYPAEVFANGPSGGELKYVGCVNVASGIITLPQGRTAKKIVAFLGFKAPFRSAKLAYGAQMGTALAQHKKVEKIGLIAFDTHYQGVTYGQQIDNLQALPLVEHGQVTPSDTVWSEFDRPMIGLSGSWDTDSRLHLMGSAPRPATIAGVVVSVSTSEAR